VSGWGFAGSLQLTIGFSEFFDRYFHIPLLMVTKHELGLPFPPRNLPIKFGTNPSTIFLVIVVTDRQTDTQTNAGKTYSSLSLREKHDRYIHTLSIGMCE